MNLSEKVNEYAETNGVTRDELGRQSRYEPIFVL